MPSSMQPAPGAHTVEAEAGPEAMGHWLACWKQFDILCYVHVQGWPGRVARGMAVPLVPGTPGGQVGMQGMMHAARLVPCRAL